MQESRYPEIQKYFFYKSLNIHNAVSPYQVWNKIKTDWLVASFQIGTITKNF